MAAKKIRAKTKVTKKKTTTAPPRGTSAPPPRSQAADIVLTNTRVVIQGSTIRIMGSQNNALATFDSRTAKFTVHGKLAVGKTDVMAKLEALENRIKKLES